MLAHYLKRGAYITSLYTASSVVVRALNFVMLPYFLSRLSLTEFGIWDFYQLIFSTGTLLVTSCASTSLFRFYVFYKDDKQKQEQAVGNSLVSVFFLSIAVFLVVLMQFIGVIEIPFFSKYTMVTLISVAFFGLYTMILSLLRVQEKLVHYSLVFCGQNFLALSGTLIGVYYDLGITSFFYANLFSFFIFVPWFLSLLYRVRSCNFEVFKKQVSFSVPLLFFNLIYMGFFIVDKIVIKNFIGFEALGLYSILWRFGSIFQMIAIALIDAWYLIIYHAQKEEDGQLLINRLVKYYAITLASFCLYCVLGSFGAILFLFPVRYHYIVHYVPLFFMPLFFVEIARLFQTAFGLSTKTFYLPVITGLVLGVQSLLLLVGVHYGLVGIFLANGMTFTLYALICALVGKKIYNHSLIATDKITKILFFIISFILALQIMAYYAIVSWSLLAVIGILWPLYVWVGEVIDVQEKVWLITIIRSWYNQKIGKCSGVKSN